MIPILIAYGTTEGQTGKIAEFMARVLNEAGFRADVVDTASAQSAVVQPTYAAAILGSSIHAGHHSRSLTKFVTANAAWLRTIPSAFFSVSLTAVRDDDRSRAEAERMIAEFLAGSGLEPVQTCRIAGALRYSRYGLVKRLVMRRIARKEGGGTDVSRDFEYTDWDSIRTFVLDFARAYGGSPRQVA